MSSPIFLVPHTHWDREWYELAGRFRQRLVAAVDGVLQLLESRRLAVFLLDGQTALLHDYLAVRPDEEPRIRRLAEAGRLLPGPWFILADELLPADETLVRNLLVGRADGRRFGGWLPLGYSPDAFGHPAALPTVLAGFGITHGLLWRGYGGEPGQGADLFRWRGPEGSSVLMHHLPPAGYELGANLPTDQPRLERRWRVIARALEPRAAGRPLLVLCGADHHAPQPDLEQAAAALTRIAGRAVAIASPAEYFEAVEPAQEVPEVSGELRFSSRHTCTLQGAHATRASLKRLVREGERLLLRWAEPQATLARAGGGDDRKALLGAAWRTHLLNCFHDTLAGTTVDAVARAARARAETVIAQARGLADDALHDRLDQDRTRARRARHRWKPTLVVVNPSAYDRSGVVEASVCVATEPVAMGRAAPRSSGTRIAAPQLSWPDGRPIAYQVLGAYDGYDRLDAPDAYPLQDRVRVWRIALWVDDVPALGLRTVRVGQGQAKAATGGRAQIQVRGATLVGRRWRVRGDGSRGYTLEDGERGTAFPGVADVVSEADAGDAYTFEPVPGEPPRAARWGKARVVWRGPLIGALAREFTVPGAAAGTVYARLDAGSGIVRFAVEGVNQAAGHRLRLRFPLPALPALRVHVADMQYGPVRREREEYDARDFPLERPVQTAPLQRYVTVPAGLTVHSRDACEYELTADGAIVVTLFRSVDQLSKGDLTARPGHVAWPVAIPEARELGAFRVEVGVSRGASEPLDAWVLEAEAEEFAAPLAGRTLRYAMGARQAVRGPRLTGDGLALKAVKPRDDGRGLVLRAVNLRGVPVQGSWVLPFRARRAARARLDETPGATLAVAGGGRQVVFEAGPREIVTIVVDWSAPRRKR